MDGQPSWTDCDEAGDYVVPNVLSLKDLVSSPDIMDKTVPHTHKHFATNFMKIGEVVSNMYIWSFCTFHNGS